MITAQEIFDQVKWEKVKTEKEGQYNGNHKKYIEYYSMQYLSELVAKTCRTHLEKDTPKHFELRRGIVTPKRATQEKITKIWDEFQELVKNKLNCDTRYWYHNPITEISNKVDKAPLLVKTTFLSVRGFLDKAKIGNYSIVQKSSRMIETNEFSRCLVGFYSEIAKQGAIAFESKSGKVKSYIIHDKCGTEMKEVRIPQMQKLIDHYMEEKLQVRARGSNFCAVYSPKIGQGGIVLGDNVVLVFISSKDNPDDRDAHPVANFIKKGNEDFEKTKKMIEDYDSELIYYEDPDCKEKFDMAAVMQEV
jgi:hypothetical protein